MKKIFLDCGAHNGSSVRYFFKNWPDAEQYEIYSFEPDPQYFNRWPVHNVELINKAVWIEDCTKTFYITKSRFEDAGGSTLCYKKHKHNYRKLGYRVGYSFDEIQVECIDIDKFIRENFNIDDYIIFKIDIEGEEYEVIPYMLEKETFSYINELYGEWHNWRAGRENKPLNVKGYIGAEDRKYIQLFEEKYGLMWKEWDCITS